MARTMMTARKRKQLEEEDEQEEEEDEQSEDADAAQQQEEDEEGARRAAAAAAAAARGGAAADSEEDLDQQDADEDEDAAAGPSSKRARSEYPKGTVKKVRVCNFMTYGSPPVTITPGPRLNLVLGPNGTGKSSLVCALCLGLTGPPRLLGRADNLKDFIRRGAQAGWVETTLSGGPGRRDAVVRCDMQRTGEGYSTHWRVNGATKTMKEVKELVTSFNIQFDNLCQFLPQDKVVEFARMDPYELLVATEKAIGDASLHDTHMALIARRGDMRRREQEHAALQQQHDQLVADNAALEREYQRFEKRQKLIKGVAMMKKKLAWMGVKEAQEAARAADEEEKRLKAELTAAQRAAKGDERPARRRREAADAAKQELAGLQATMRKQEAAANKANERMGKEEEAVRRLRGELEGLAAASARARQDQEKLAAKLQEAREQLESLPPVPDHTARLAELRQQQNATLEQIQAIDAERVSMLQEQSTAQLERVRIEAGLRECDSAAYQRLRTLAHARNLPALPDFAAWVAAQRAAGAFRGEVAGPLGVEVRLKQPTYAGYLEMATWGQLANFAVQDRADERLLIEELRQRRLTAVRVVVVAGDVSQPIRTRSAELKGHGVACCLDEVYDAPPLVKHALNNTCWLDTVYVMADHNLAKVRKLMEDRPDVRQVYTPQQNITYIKSSYGGKEDSSLQTRGLRPATVLGGGGGLADVEQRKAQLQGQLAAKMQQLSGLEARLASSDAAKAPLEQAMADLGGERDRLTRETANAQAKRTKLNRSLKEGERIMREKASAPDPLSKAPALERQLSAALTKHAAALGELLEAQEARWGQLQEHILTELVMREADMQARAMSAAIEAQRATLTGLTRQHKTAHDAAKAAVAAYKAAQADAQQHHPLDQEAREAFQDLADDRAELVSDLRELEDKVDTITVNNPRVAQEYRARKDEIEVKGAALAALAQRLADDKAEIERLKSQWLPELTRVVGLINTSFATNFSTIGCAGEVVLGRPEPAAGAAAGAGTSNGGAGSSAGAAAAAAAAAVEEDYERFSIQIRVKFREHEALTQLTAHRQSGGERSVSTILYLIALQGVSVTPFRVVDEINQGMDPANERKVFEQLVVASCQEGTPQCFLLTPKLLPDLPFTEDITVLNIFNGGMVPEEVAGSYSFATLVGSNLMRKLEQQQRRVPVAG